MKTACLQGLQTGVFLFAQIKCRPTFYGQAAFLIMMWYICS
jgi:hypothetical protein